MDQLKNKIEILKSAVQYKLDQAEKTSDPGDKTNIELIYQKLDECIFSIKDLPLLNTKIENSVEYLKNTIQNIFNLDFDKINNLLIKYRAVIAGGTP